MLGPTGQPCRSRLRHSAAVAHVFDKDAIAVDEAQAARAVARLDAAAASARPTPHLRRLEVGPVVMLRPTPRPSASTKRKRNMRGMTQVHPTNMKSVRAMLPYA